MANEILVHRFGNPYYFRNSLSGLEMEEELTLDNNPSGKKNHEATRQRYLRYLHKHMLIWEPVNEKYDSNVEMSKIIKNNPRETLGFMKIKPNGFRGQRRVPDGFQYLFYVVMGTVIATHNGEERVITLNQGNHLTVQGGESVGLRNSDMNEIAILIMRISPKVPKIREQTINID